MTPERRDLDVWRGNDALFTFRVSNDEGDSLALNDDIYKMIIEADEVISATTASALAPLTGEFTVKLNPDQTRSLTAHTHIPNYELVRVRDGVETTILFGTLRVGGTIKYG